MTKWNDTDLPDLAGRSAIVTGANSGIGRAAATALARAGARVTLAVRDPAKGEQAAAEMGGDVDVRRLDLADLASVRGFADGWDEPLHTLINNAGVMATPERRTVDGFELQVGTNHLGHFALTNLLLPKITDRVVVVASGAHRMGKIRLDDLNWEQPGAYKPWTAYGQSKLANLLFALELQRRLQAAGSPLRVTAAHPGWSATNLQFHTEQGLVDRVSAIGNRLIAQSERMGALPTLFAATQDLPGASYVGPGGPFELRGHPTLVGRSAAASDVATAERLWALSEQLTGTSFPLELAAA